MDEKLFSERLQIYDDAINCRKPSRIPTMANVFTWKILDSDTKATVTEATSDWALMEQIVREHMARYSFDGYQDYGTRNNSALAAILGDMQHVINEETGAIYALDHELLKPDEYDEYIADPVMFHWTKVAPRKFGSLTYGQIQDAVKASMAFGQYAGNIMGVAVNEFSVPLTQKNYALHPIEGLFNSYRGIKGFSEDMRRVPGKLLDFVASQEGPLLESAAALLKTPRDIYICDLYQAWLVTSIMSPKQFEKFYYPTFKKLIDMLVEQGKSMYLFVEAEFLRYYEYFQDIPKGHLIVHIEKDDIFEAKKKLPNICIAGGMPVDLLGKASKEVCLDRAKLLCDELGGDGFVFSQNKMMSFPYDATRENMLAVQEYVLNYRP